MMGIMYKAKKIDLLLFSGTLKNKQMWGGGGGEKKKIKKNFFKKKSLKKKKERLHQIFLQN